MPIAAAEVLGKPDPPRRWMLCLSLAQGLVLLWLWRAVDAEWWPSQTPGINFPLWALAIVWPGLVACFLALFFLQSWAGRQRITYDALFALSWRNFLVASLATLATAVFYGVLLLWGELFSAIDIPFFEDVFDEDWFLFPVLALSLGLAIDIFRRLVTLIAAR